MKIGDTIEGYDLKLKKKVPFEIKDIKTTTRGARIAMGMSKDGHKISRILKKE